MKTEQAMNIRLLILHAVLVSSSLHTNKYVLSSLRFTFPTIFQGWQMGGGFLILRLASAYGLITINYRHLTRKVFTAWLPVAFTFTISIYSGSVALSRLNIPVFLCLTYTSGLVNVVLQMAMQHKIISVAELLQLCISATASIPAWIINFETTEAGYHWMILCVLSSGFTEYLSKLIKPQLHIEDMEQLYLNHLMSSIFLLPGIYILGDYSNSQEFGFWYHFRFHFGCLLSLLFCMLLSINLCQVTEQHQNAIVTMTTSTAKLLAAAVSVGTFTFSAAVHNQIWLVIGLTLPIISTVWIFQRSPTSSQNQADSDDIV